MRFLVTFLSALVGMTLGAVQLFMALPRPGAPAQSDAAAFEACIAFFAGAYCTGRILYTLLKLRTEAETVAATSRWHLTALHIAALSYVLLSAGAQGLLHRLFEPALLATLAGTLWSLWEIIARRVPTKTAPRGHDDTTRWERESLK